MFQLPEVDALRTLSRDGRLLFATRTVRLFAYGFLAIILGLYLSASGLTDTQIGLVLSLTLLGDAAIALPITIIADRLGRRRMLIVGSGLMILAAAVFVFSGDIIHVVIPAGVGTMRPSRDESQCFLSIMTSDVPHNN